MKLIPKHNLSMTSTGDPNPHSAVPGCMSVERRSVDGTTNFTEMKTMGTAILYRHPRIALSAQHVWYQGPFRKATIVYIRTYTNPAGVVFPPDFIPLADGKMPAHDTLDLRMLVLDKDAKVPFVTRLDLPALPVDIVMQGYGGPNNPNRENRQLPAHAYMVSSDKTTFAASLTDPAKAYPGDSGSPAFPFVNPTDAPPTQLLGLLSTELSTGQDRLVFTALTLAVDQWVVEQAGNFGIQLKPLPPAPQNMKGKANS